LVPRARPSPYAKRWWTKDLTTLRQSLTTARNAVTAARRRGDDVVILLNRLQRARSVYFQMIEKQKKAHWKDFLDNITNIWTANQYTKAASKSSTILELRKGGQVAQREEEKADMLMDTFFP